MKAIQGGSPGANKQSGGAAGSATTWDRSLGGGTVAHNVTYVVIGVVFIWFGWFGFNGGNALTPGAVASTALVNTNVAAGFGMVTWMLFETLAGSSIGNRSIS